MASSGLKTKDEVVKSFNDVKLNHLYQYVLFKISDNNQDIELDKVGPPTSEKDVETAYAEFLDALPEREGRYAVYDFKIEAKAEGVEGGGRTVEKLLFINWCPDTLKVKEKMIMASSADAVKKKLDGIQIYRQAADKGDIDFNEIKTLVLNKSH